MADNPLDDPALRALLAAERDAPEPSGEAQDRVWKRVAAAVALPPMPGDGGLTTVTTAKAGLAVKLGLSVGLVAGGGGLWVALQPADPPLPRNRIEKTIAPASVPAQPMPEAAQPPVPTIDHALAAERALIAEATRAIRARSAANARAALDRHAAAFAAGRLAEEREALWVHVLVLEGAPDEARRAAADFARRHPDSLFNSALRHALENR